MVYLIKSDTNYDLDYHLLDAVLFWLTRPRTLWYHRERCEILPHYRLEVITYIAKCLNSMCDEDQIDGFKYRCALITDKELLKRHRGVVFQKLNSLGYVRVLYNYNKGAKNVSNS